MRIASDATVPRTRYGEGGSHLGRNAKHHTYAYMYVHTTYIGKVGSIRTTGCSSVLGAEQVSSRNPTENLARSIRS